MKMTQERMLLEHFQGGGTITGLQAFRKPFRTICLPRRVKDLRDAGYKIEMKWITTSTGKRVGLYSMKGKKKT